MPEAAYRISDRSRRIATNRLDRSQRSELGQFLTPSSLADFMASLFKKWEKKSCLLEPGAGVGSLIESSVHEFFRKSESGSALEITAYEIDNALLPFLRENLGKFRVEGIYALKPVSCEVIADDFITQTTAGLFSERRKFTHAILNPPYKKISSSSSYRNLLRHEGIETTNLYAAFLALTIALMRDGGEIVAIVPRSFCNGPYFRQFRKWLLDKVAIRQIHLFESRTEQFADDAVLQENIILHLERGATTNSVVISSSRNAMLDNFSEKTVAAHDVIKPLDPEQFIRIPANQILGPTYPFHCHLKELGIEVSTGPVVDFRLKKYLLHDAQENTAPLLYSHHFRNGGLKWPRAHKKPNAIIVNEETKRWLMPRGWYTVTKRFTSKEERRRIVAHIVDPNLLEGEYIGFENHLNVFHSKRFGISAELARGLSIFLNSSMVDNHFRSFSGHTQVNATDLRTMSFPSRQALISMGNSAGTKSELSQEIIDELVEVNGER